MESFAQVTVSWLVEPEFRRAVWLLLFLVAKLCPSHCENHSLCGNICNFKKYLQVKYLLFYGSSHSTE